MTDLSFSLVQGGEARLRGPRDDARRRDDAASAGPALDPVRLDELRATLGEERLAGLLGLLVADCVARPRRLRDCLARDDAMAMRAEAHNLARAAESVGASALAVATRALASLTEGVAPGRQLALVEHAAAATLRIARHLQAAAPTRVIAH